MLPNTNVKYALEEGREKGLAEGREKGIVEGCAEGKNRLAQLLPLLYEKGQTEEERKAAKEGRLAELVEERFG